MTDYKLVPVERCAACGNEKPVSEMKTCMHNQMHRYVCDSKCMNDFYNPPKNPRSDTAAPAVQGEHYPSNEWLPANGKKPCLPNSTLVDVKFADGFVSQGNRVDFWIWMQDGSSDDITHYRIHQPVTEVQGEPASRVVPSRDDLIQCLLATHGQSEGITADAILSMLTTAPLPAEQQSISPTLASEAAKHLSNWLEMDMCECEFGHTCGYNEVKRTRDALLAVAEQKPMTDVAGLVQQHHRDSAELRRLCQARDQQRDGRLAALERAAKAEADISALVAALEEAYGTLERAVSPADETPEAAIQSAMFVIEAALAELEKPSFQSRVQSWLMECFGEMIAGDKEERNHRFLEEALELVQVCGCTYNEAHQLVDYVYGRPFGEKAQEVGGVMVTLAALCLAQKIDLHECAEVELARVWTKVEQIREKQKRKPAFSPLPGCYPERAQPSSAKDPANTELNKQPGGGE